MSRPRFSTALYLALSLQAAGCGAALAAAISDPDMAVLPDPVLSEAARFPAGAATAGVAHVDPARDDVDVQARGCSPLHPCALPTPAAPDEVAAQPTRLTVRRAKTLKEFSAATGQDRHSVMVDYKISGNAPRPDLHLLPR